MITNFLLDHSELAPVLLLLTAVVCVCMGLPVLRAPRIVWVYVGLSVLVVLVLTLVPAAGGRFFGTYCAVQFDVPTLGSVELLANVSLFVPPVFFAALATRRPLVVLAAGSALSAAIEAAQALMPAGGRACDTNDWLMNTIGAVVGALLAWGTMALAHRAAVRKAG